MQGAGLGAALFINIVAACLPVGSGQKKSFTGAVSANVLYAKFPGFVPRNSRGGRKLEYIAGNLMFELGKKTQKLRKIFEKMPSTA